MDTDTIFHGVDRVAETAEPVGELRPGMRLRFDADRQWSVVDGERVVNRYRWENLRFSISWKAYCFADEAERAAWKTHSQDLDVAKVVDRLVEDLLERGRIDARPSDDDLVDVIIDEYIRFPAPQAA